MCEWIEVGDKLPYEHRPIHVWLNNEMQRVIFEHGKLWFDTAPRHYAGELDEVRWWQPLSPPPTSEAWNRRQRDAAPGEAELYERLEELAKAIMRRPAPYSDEPGRKHYELAHDTLKLLRARALLDSE